MAKKPTTATLVIDAVTDGGETTYSCTFDRLRPFPPEAEDEHRLDVSVAANERVTDGDTRSKARSYLAFDRALQAAACALFDASCQGVTSKGATVPLTDVPPEVKRSVVEAIHERRAVKVFTPGQSSVATS